MAELPVVCPRCSAKPISGSVRYVLCEQHTRSTAPKLPDGRYESVVREIENIALGKLRLSKFTGMDCTLSMVEAAAVLDMLRSG